MTIDAQGAPTPRAPERRRLAGVGVGAGVLVLVAVPVSISVVLAVFSFSEPGSGRWIGALFAGFALILLAIPVVAGLLTARVLTASGWKVTLVITALGLGLLLGPLTLSRLGQ